MFGKPRFMASLRGVVLNYFLFEITSATTKVKFPISLYLLKLLKCRTFAFTFIERIVNDNKKALKP